MNIKNENEINTCDLHFTRYCKSYDVKSVEKKRNKYNLKFGLK